MEASSSNYRDTYRKSDTFLQNCVACTISTGSGYSQLSLIADPKTKKKTIVLRTRPNVLGFVVLFLEPYCPSLKIIPTFLISSLTPIDLSPPSIFCRPVCRRGNSSGQVGGKRTLLRWGRVPDAPLGTETFWIYIRRYWIFSQARKICAVSRESLKDFKWLRSPGCYFMCLLLSHLDRFCSVKHTNGAFLTDAAEIPSCTHA